MSAVAEMTSLPIREAVEARDLAAVREAFAPDAVLRSPNTGSLKVEGREQIGALYKVILEVFADLEYIDELRGENSALLMARAHVDGVEIEIADHLRFDENGKIRVLTVFFRPMPAMALASRYLGAAIGRNQSPFRARLISFLSAPMVAQTRTADRLANRLLGPGLRDT
ncbi:MAG TPA: nuclear transport factor 2 family protein [Thermoleophilaceae bacterium]|jgi:hypothetical protein